MDTQKATLPLLQGMSTGVVREAQAASHRAQCRHPALYKACQEFESLFILQLWRAMQRTVPNSTQTLNYAEMFDLHFADYLAQRGQFGIAEQLYQQLSRHLPEEGANR